jgi:hypothetical protein
MENSRDIMGIVILRPGKIVTISIEFDALALANNNGLWCTGSGAFQASIRYESRLPPE